jgi:hypothetical protein
MTAKQTVREELEAKDRRIDNLIAEAEKNLSALIAVVAEMQRQAAAQQGTSEGQ